MEFVVAWVLFGIASAIVASKKGRSAGGWFILGLLFGPLGLILALVVSSKDEALEQRAIEDKTMKKCQHCAELIKYEATKCRIVVKIPTAHLKRCRVDEGDIRRLTETKLAREIGMLAKSML